MVKISKRVVWELNSGGSIIVTDRLIFHARDIYVYLKKIKDKCDSSGKKMPDIKCSDIARACNIHISKIVYIVTLMSEKKKNPVVRIKASHFITKNGKYVSVQRVELLDQSK